jgi:hypothetical protein
MEAGGGDDDIGLQGLAGFLEDDGFGKALDVVGDH